MYLRSLVKGYFLFYLCFSTIQSFALPRDCFFLVRRISFQYTLIEEKSEFGFGPVLKYIAGKQTPPLQGRKEIIIGSYNILNLDMTMGKYVHDPRTGMIELKSPKRPKPARYKKEAAQVILDSGMDIVTLQEVESYKALTKFAQQELEGLYVPLLIRGNDQRMIDVGFLIKRDLDVSVELHSFRRYEGEYFGESRPIFSRDFPVMVVKNKQDNKPLMVIGGLHMKSKRAMGGDRDSDIFRTQQMKSMLEVADIFEKKYGRQIPFFMAGDFNGTIEKRIVGRELESVYENGFQDTFDLAGDQFTGGPRVTHTYHPRNAPTEARQLDGILCRGEGCHDGLIIRAGISRYYENGIEKPIPTTHAKRKKNPSDHFPVWSAVNLEKLL